MKKLLRRLLFWVIGLEDNYGGEVRLIRSQAQEDKDCAEYYRNKPLP